MVNVFTEWDQSVHGRALLANHLVDESSGIEHNSISVFTGHEASVSFFDGVDFGGVKLGKGVLFTSGDGTPPLTNTQTNYSVSRNLPGDTDLTDIVRAAFPGAGFTGDATVFEFEITVEPGVKSIVFDVLFGSDEFPEYSNTKYVDIAAILVNGKNAAFFDGDPARPLSVLDVNEQYFLDNVSDAHPIEYDGISNKLVVIAPVHEGTNTIKIAIADTEDLVFDSGVFVSAIRGTTKDLIGILKQVGGTTAKDKLKAEPGVDTLLVGDLGADKLFANTGYDVMFGDLQDDSGTGAAMASAKGATPNYFKDVFFFKSVEFLEKNIAGTDVIADFDKRDVINLAKLTGPKLDFIGKARFSDNGDGEVRYKQFKQDDYTGVYVDTDGNGKADVSVKVLGLHKLKEEDFAL